MTELRPKVSFVHSFVYCLFTIPPDSVLDTRHMHGLLFPWSLDFPESLELRALSFFPLSGGLEYASPSILVLGPMMALGLALLPSTLGQWLPLLEN